MDMKWTKKWTSMDKKGSFAIHCVVDHSPHCKLIAVGKLFLFDLILKLNKFELIATHIMSNWQL